MLLTLGQVPALGQAPPLQASVVRVTDLQLELRWDPVPRALGYEVLSLRNGTWWLNESEPSYTPATSSTVLSGLSPNSEYQFRIRAVLRGGSPLLGPVLVVHTAQSGESVATPLRESRPLPESVLAGATPPAPVAEKELPAKQPEPAQEPVENLNAPISDLLPPPPRKATPPAQGSRPAAAEKPKGPPPPAPSTVMGLYVKQDEIRLSWRRVDEATGYLVEEQKDGAWQMVEEGLIEENRPSILVRSRPAPGPYYFRVLALRNGARSQPSFTVKMER